MSEEIIVGMPDSGYYTNPEARKAIDEALKQCAKLHTQTGTRQLRYSINDDGKKILDEDGMLVDELGSREAELFVREQENRILGAVSHWDETFVDSLMYDEDSFDLD